MVELVCVFLKVSQRLRSQCQNIFGLIWSFRKVGKRSKSEVTRLWSVQKGLVANIIYNVRLNSTTTNFLLIEDTITCIV